MNEEMIGTLAGKIWAVLSEQPMTVTPKGKDFVYSLN